MLMKRFLALLSILMLLPTGPVHALSDAMNHFREGAILLLEGIDNNDRAALTDAADMLAAADSSEFEDFTVTLSAPDALSDPTVIFSTDFCNELRKNGFTLVPLDPLDALRNVDSAISTITRTLAPGASATFTVDCEGETSLVAVGSIPGALSVDVGINGGVANPLEGTADGYSLSNSWDTGTYGSITATLTNTSGFPVSFVLAFQ